MRGKVPETKTQARDDPSLLATLADWLRYAERRFRRARLAFGHGTGNAYDEAAWLLLHVAKRPYDALTGALPLVLTAPQRRRALTLVEKHIATRKPLAHLLREAWLGEHRFYVDERVIVPRSHGFGLSRDSACSRLSAGPRRRCGRIGLGTRGCAAKRETLWAAAPSTAGSFRYVRAAR